MRASFRHPRGMSLLVAATLGLLLGASVSVSSAEAAPPFTLDDHRDLRPGAPILPDSWLSVQTFHGETRDLSCTANFVFADDDGHRYLGTAGHCAPVPRGVHAWPWPEGPAAHDMAYDEIGHFVFAGTTLETSAIPLPLVGLVSALDLALIRLHDHVDVNPQMAHFGGPTALNDDLTQLPVVLHMYGWGVHGVNFQNQPTAFEQPVHGRTFVAPSMPFRDVVHEVGLAGGGDSGAPVISADGRAVGIVSGMNYGDHRVGPDGVGTGTIVIVRLGPQVAAAEAALGVTLTLQTAPLS